jgi:hypothetical protein
MTRRLIFVLLFTGVILASCARCTLNGFSFSRSVSILSYNVENLFDDRDDGSEYSDYDPGEGSWDTALYHAKLKNVSEAIRASGDGGPDICLLQEVENERVVTDLLEGHLNVLKYRYAVTAPKNQSATTVTILSRFKPEAVFVHSIFVDDRVPLRPILEVWFDIHGDGLVLLNNHWKSKSGGVRETEVYRRAAAGFISERVASIRSERPDLCVIVAGDLNERVNEFSAAGGEYPTALMIDGDGGGVVGAADKTLRLTGKWNDAGYGLSLFFSPWLDTTLRGSYAYAGSWEKIDHFLIAGAPDGSGFAYAGFEVIDEDFLLNREGYPRRWSTRLADGYSDHLPIMLKMKR